MRRDKESIRLLITIVTIFYWVSQNGVKGNPLKDGKSEGGNNQENEKLLDTNEKKVEPTDDTENLNDDTSDLKSPDSDSDATNTFDERVREMPFKLGLQFLAAKYGISESLDKARRGGTHIYNGAKDAIKTMADFIGKGIDNARFLLFGTS